ncbi:MAG: hypothetical protein ABIM77_07975 [candidate division WOR-3 bacterium]
MKRLSPWLLVLLSGLLAVAAGWALGEPSVADSPTPSAVCPADTNHFVYLPLVFKAPDACEPIPETEYNVVLSVNDLYDPTKPSPENNPDYRLSLLGYYPVDRYKGLVNYGPTNDSKAPKFTTLFEGQPTPPILNTYQANGWDWDNHQPISGTPHGFEVTVIGLQSSPKAIVRVPDSGYVIGWDCGDGGCDAMVIYASRWEISLKYTREDRVSYPPPQKAGFTVHIVGICVEPSLRALYEQMNAQGRYYLPAVRGGQPIGRAWGGEIAVAIRDDGPFMDPRDCDSFWKGYCP